MSSSGSGVDAEPITLDGDAVGQLLMAAIRSQEGNAFFRGLVAGLGYPAWVVEGNWHLACGEAQIIPGPAGGTQNGPPVIRQGTPGAQGSR
jgi:hypothetical protein